MTNLIFTKMLELSIKRWYIEIKMSFTLDKLKLYLFLEEEVKKSAIRKVLF